MTKENLIQLSNDTFKSNNARLITADNHRFFNEQLIDSMATGEQGRMAESAIQGAKLNGVGVPVFENLLDITLENPDCSVWCSAITSSGLLNGLDNLKWRINGDTLELSGVIGTTLFTDNYFRITNIPSKYAKRVISTEVMAWGTFPNGSDIVLVNVGGSNGSVTVSHESLSKLSSIRLNAVVPLAPFSVSAGIMDLLRGLNVSCLTYGGGLFMALGNSALFFGISYASSTDGKDWTVGSISTIEGEIIITDVTVNSVAYGNGRFVAVGGPNHCIVSENAVSWRTIRTDLNVLLRDVIFVKDKFIAVGDSGSCFISRDGELWEKIEVETSWPLVSIAYGNGVYFLLGSGSYYFYTSDFESWEKGTLSFITVDVMYAGGGKFYLVGESGHYACVIPGQEGYTTGHVGWSSGLGSIAYGDGVFVALNDIGYTFSNDGKIWSVEVASNPLSDIVYGDNKFVAVGGTRFMTFER